MINTTGELKEVIRKAFKQTQGATVDEQNKCIKRAFQAIRIATNYELLNLQRFFDQCPDSIVDRQGILMVITFHSLEEKMVVQQFSRWKKEKLGQFGNKKPILADQREIEENGSKSRSAKLYSFLFY